MEAGPYLRIGKALADEVYDLELFVSEGCPQALRNGEVLHESKLVTSSTPYIVQLSDIDRFIGLHLDTLSSELVVVHKKEALL